MKRLVSYIYKYSEGVKGENIGVGKIDVNKDTLKINITLGFDKEIKNLKVCFFVKQDETTKLINIGNMNKTDIGFSIEKTVDIASITNNEIGISDIYGIIIMGEEIECISFWKKEYKVEKCQDYFENIEVEEEDTIYLIDKECMSKNCKKDIEIEKQEVPTARIEEFFKEIKIPQELVNGKQCNILGISPKDIYELPREYWSLSKNAYVCYSSIKYGKVYILEDDGLYLAVPGYSSLGEQILAEKYGFDIFLESEVKELKESSVEKWKRGYWCKKLNLTV